MSKLFSMFEIPTSNTLGGVAATQTVLQCVMVKVSMSFRGDIILQLCTGSKFCFPNAQAHCMSELCSKFQIPAINTVGADPETRQYYSVIWSKIGMSFKVV